MSIFTILIQKIHHIILQKMICDFISEHKKKKKTPKNTKNTNTKYVHQIGVKLKPLFKHFLKPLWSKYDNKI